MTDGDYTTVRAAIANWFSTANIDGVQHVFRSAPWYLDGRNFNLTAGYAANLFIHIDSSAESRITVPAVTGNKEVNYVVSVVILYKFQMPDFLPPGMTEDIWVDPLDAIIDALKTRIRSDPAFGTGGSPIFQAGQGGGGQPDIRIDQDLPSIDADSIVFSLARIEFDVTSILIA